MVDNCRHKSKVKPRSSLIQLLITFGIDTKWLMVNKDFEVVNMCLDRQVKGPGELEAEFHSEQERRGISITNVWDDQADGGGGSVLPQRDCCQPVAAWTMVCLPPPVPCNDTD